MASTLNLNNALAPLAEYGQAVINRVDFVRARVRPSLAVGASPGADLMKRDNAPSLQLFGTPAGIFS